ncbi:MAG: hypothetical protein GF364_14615 [Candidatus Lokiarchaeota archaeon]|nr:hypothetical protein [Candidatus Lokiarchaeota archaeon]
MAQSETKEISQNSPGSQQKKIHIRTLKSNKYLKRLMAWYFFKAKIYPKIPWKYTAWTTSAFPVEMLWTYDIFPLHPENSATVAAARKVSKGLIEYAEGLGFSRDLCSYFKTNIGAYDKKIGTTYGGIEKPDFICTTGTICDTHVKWFQTQGRRMNVPVFIFDLPHQVAGCDEKTLKRYEDYIVDQFYEWNDFVYDITGKKLKQKRLETVVRKSDRLCQLWQEIYSYRKKKPSPLGFNDTFAQIFPLVILPGIDAGIKYYEKVLAEIKDLATKGKGVVPNEKYRLLFEGIPFWYRIKFIFELAQLGASIVYEPYTWAFGPRKPLGLSADEYLHAFARMWLQQPYYYNLDRRMEYFKEVIDEYSIDGVILHNNMSCRPNSTGMLDLKKMIQREIGIPAIIIEADMNDPRAYAEAAIKTRIEGFIELLEANSK